MKKIEEHTRVNSFGPDEKLYVYPLKKSYDPSCTKTLISYGEGLSVGLFAEPEVPFMIQFVHNNDPNF